MDDDHGHPRPTANRTGAHPGRALAPLLAALSLGCATARPTLRLHFVDVGQGDATLLEFPCAAALIDTGGEESARFSGKERLSRYLERFFADRPELGGRLELLVLTHAHVDHTRGAKDVLELYRPRHVVTNGLERGSGRHGQRAAHRWAEGGPAGPGQARLERVRARDVPPGGRTSAVIDPIDCDAVDPELRVLWGGLDEAEAEQNGNNHSVVLHLRFGRASALFTGDLEKAAIARMLALHRGHEALAADVYQVGHHGSRNATTPELLDAVRPKLAVISMGHPAREAMWTAWAFGHPHAEVVALLDARLPRAPRSRTVWVGQGAKRFEPRALGGALYGTGWDGDVVLETTTDGEWVVRRPE